LDLARRNPIVQGPSGSDIEHDGVIDNARSDAGSFAIDLDGYIHHPRLTWDRQPHGLTCRSEIGKSGPRIGQG